MNRNRQKQWDSVHMHTTSCRLPMKVWCFWIKFCMKNGLSQHEAIKRMIYTVLEVDLKRENPSQYSTVMETIDTILDDVLKSTVRS